ncbi:MAG: fluoride efflux transporter CrcB, partial [Actinomycetospora chiangmaiensis]|nr:fluoride efflux transporter CrcB [Actinomycetospora chiangmaiensis]
MINTLIVILGAGLGGGARHGINVAVSRLLPGLGFPLAT